MCAEERRLVQYASERESGARYFMGLNCPFPLCWDSKVLGAFYIWPKSKRGRAEFNSFCAIGECAKRV